MVDAPANWDALVNSATTLEELDALWAQASRGGFSNRARYLLVKRNQATLRQVNAVLDSTAQKALAPLNNLTQQGAGALFRNVVPGLVDQFGNVNAQIARQYYLDQRDVAWKAIETGGFTKYRRTSISRATAVTKAQIALSQGYTPVSPKFDAITRSESTINYSMKLFQSMGGAASTEIRNALTRAVASYNRDTILYNSALDAAVVGVQRVAEPGACKFCQMVAFQKGGRVRVSSYAANYHNNCRCSIETLYAGDAPYAPHYYKNFDYAPPDGELTFATFRPDEILTAVAANN